MTIAERFDRPDEFAAAALADAEIVLPLEGLIDREAEQARIRKQVADLEKQLGGPQAKLNNEGFLAKAPADVVANLRAKVADLQAQIAALKALLK